MTKIISSPNCGNSPKMEFIKQFNIAFAKGDMDFIRESVTDDIVLSLVGDKKIVGIKSFTEELEKMKTMKVKELKIEQILSHGKEGAANGILKMQDGKSYAFADFYAFQGAKNVKIKMLTSYVIGI